MQKPVGSLILLNVSINILDEIAKKLAWRKARQIGKSGYEGMR